MELVEKKIKRARTALILDHCFFGTLALNMKLIEDPTCPTGWIDGKHIAYNPKWINTLTANQVTGFFAHEVMHVVLFHHTRRGERNQKRWNMAADYALNDILIADGFELPNGCLKGFGLDDYAESIYNKLPDDDSGSGNDPGGCGEVRDAKNENGDTPTESEAKQIESDTKVLISQAYNVAKMMGKVSANIKRIVGEVLEAKVPWEESLNRFLDAFARNDYTWAKGNRRYISTGVFLPSLYNEELGKLGISTDTSGSVTGNGMNQFASEISYIIEKLKASAIVMYVDSKVCNVEEFSYDMMPLEFHPSGGGGTSFVPPFKYIEENNHTITCMVYLTDGECNDFPEPPEYPVLWAVIGNRKFEAPFGEIIHIE